MSPKAPSRTEPPNRSTRFGFGALGTAVMGLGALALIVASVAVVWSTMTTASARFAASTSNENSLFEAAVVELEIDPDATGAATTLLVEADGLYPGLEIERCLRVTYRGTLDDAVVRLYGTSGAGTGLERFLQTTIELGSGDAPDCTDFGPTELAFSGTLGSLWADHDSFPDGVDIMTAASDGESVAVRFAVEVVSDDAAQGLTTRFGVTLEARP